MKILDPRMFPLWKTSGNLYIHPIKFSWGQGEGSHISKWKFHCFFLEKQSSSTRTDCRFFSNTPIWTFNCFPGNNRDPTTLPKPAFPDFPNPWKSPEANYCLLCRPSSFLFCNIFHLKKGRPAQPRSGASEWPTTLLPAGSLPRKIRQLHGEPRQPAEPISIGKMTKVLTSPLPSRNLRCVPVCL